MCRGQEKTAVARRIFHDKTPEAANRARITRLPNKHHHPDLKYNDFERDGRYQQERERGKKP